MQIVQISDLHISADPSANVFGVDTCWALEQVLASVMSSSEPPELIVATGDLVEDGKIASYLRLREVLLGIDVPVYVLPGNHDSPEYVAEYIAGGHIHFQFLHQQGSWCLVFLNSCVRDQGYGRLGVEQLARLESTLDRHPDTPFLVALHHTPITPCRYAGCALRDRSELLAMMAGKQNAKLVIAGHAHTAASEIRDGLHLYTSPATSAMCIHSTDLAADNFWATHSYDRDRRGYRTFDLSPNGNISTDVVWI